MTESLERRVSYISCGENRAARGQFNRENEVISATKYRAGRCKQRRVACPYSAIVLTTMMRSRSSTSTENVKQSTTSHSSSSRAAPAVNTETNFDDNSTNFGEIGKRKLFR